VPGIGLDVPKNWQPRVVTLAGPAADALQALPVQLDPEAPLWRTKRGSRLHGGNQHYYWNPIRARFGNPSMDLYELRHFCGSYLLNDLELPPQDVAQQLGHTDDGALVTALYGHPSEDLARRRIKAAMAAATHRGSVVSLQPKEASDS